MDTFFTKKEIESLGKKNDFIYREEHSIHPFRRSSDIRIICKDYDHTTDVTQKLITYSQNRDDSFDENFVKKCLNYDFIYKYLEKKIYHTLSTKICNYLMIPQKNSTYPYLRCDNAKLLLLTHNGKCYFIRVISMDHDPYIKDCDPYLINNVLGDYVCSNGEKGVIEIMEEYFCGKESNNIGLRVACWKPGPEIIMSYEIQGYRDFITVRGDYISLHRL